ncbi:MAG: SpoIIE family protein phosphatase [Planctomycetota bacterium]|jgi:sigma-B regulation protein RsbU (phosphoserine phosphatase)|nr:SpoIIE family protein phosphatase [Planctomycetota bacterium]
MSIKVKFTLTLVIPLALLALGTSFFAFFNVSDAMSEQLIGNSNNSIRLSVDIAKSMYSNLLELKVSSALQVHDTLSLYEKIINNLGTNGDGLLDMVGKLPIPVGLTIWALGENFSPRIINGAMPAEHNPYFRLDNRGRPVREEMLRLATNGETAAAMVGFTGGEGRQRSYFGKHFYLPDLQVILGLWVDIEPLEAHQRENLANAIKSLQDLFRSLKIGQSGFLFITDANGKLVVGPDSPETSQIMFGPNQLTSRPLFEDIVSASRLDQQRRVVLQGKDASRQAFIYADFIPSLKWYVGGVTFIDEINRPGQRLAISLVAAVLAVTLVLGVAAFFLVGRVTSPLGKLTRYARQLPSMDFIREDRDPLPIRELAAGGGSDEVGELSRAFLFMDQALRERVRELLASTSLRERLAGELDAAAKIQSGFLPKPLSKEETRGRFALSGFLVPAREVGGDIFDYFLLDEDRICLVIGDVAGKGVPAALFMNVAMVSVRSAAMQAKGPEEVMTQVNHHLAQSNPNDMFITLFIAFLDLASGEITYANGGHNPPLVRSPDGGLAELDQLSGPVVGAFDGVEFVRYQAKLTAGDVILLYTDGVSEAMNAKGELFGEDRLRYAFASSRAVGPAEYIEEIRETVERHVAGAEASDDFTVLCLAYGV